MNAASIPPAEFMLPPAPRADLHARRFTADEVAMVRAAQDIALAKAHLAEARRRLAKLQRSR